jgi:phage tail protein X
VPRLVTVRPGDTLAEIALRVYGRQTYTLLDLLGAVNPEIEDPSRIIAGAVLLFPSLEAQTRIVTADGGDLQVIALTTPSLRRALAAQNQLQSRMNRTVEIRTLSLHDGPDLYRVFLGAFTSPDEASRAADRLGPVLQK